MNNIQIPLTNLQKNIMQEFYLIEPTKVVLDKSKRNDYWERAKKREKNLNLKFKDTCPALADQIQRSYVEGHNIQSAVFSECVYAQTLANMFKLNEFNNCYQRRDFIPEDVEKLLNSYNLNPRYVYFNKDKSRMLIQAGSCAGIDSALITIINLVIYTIEFKEPAAKTSEFDLPKYNEDGYLQINKNWIGRHPQFKEMVEEKRGLNFFQNIGHNINDFSKKSIQYAVSNNYINTLLNVVCVEDIEGFIVMLPANQIHLWATIEGEIRTAGRNSCKVWTPKALRKFLEEKRAQIKNDNIEIERDKLEIRKRRGGNGISGYKINPLFFVYNRDCMENGNNISFRFDHVRQLRPTIAGKVFFDELLYEKAKEYYGFNTIYGKNRY